MSVKGTRQCVHQRDAAKNRFLRQVFAAVSTELIDQLGAMLFLSRCIREALKLGNIRCWPADYGASHLLQRFCRDKTCIVTSVGPASRPTEVDCETQILLLHIHKSLRMNSARHVLFKAKPQLAGGMRGTCLS